MSVNKVKDVQFKAPPQTPTEVLSECLTLIAQLDNLAEQQRIVKSLASFFEVGETF